MRCKRLLGLCLDLDVVGASIGSGDGATLGGKEPSLVIGGDLAFSGVTCLD